jgi:hypothetical protein
MVALRLTELGSEAAIGPVCLGVAFVVGPGGTTSGRTGPGSATEPDSVRSALAVRRSCLRAAKVPLMPISRPCRKRRSSLMSLSTLRLPAARGNKARSAPPRARPIPRTRGSRRARVVCSLAQGHARPDAVAGVGVRERVVERRPGRSRVATSRASPGSGSKTTPRVGPELVRFWHAARLRRAPG